MKIAFFLALVASINLNVLVFSEVLWLVRHDGFLHSDFFIRMGSLSS
jgi:hypothetical protein